MPEDIIIGRTESDKKRFGKEALIYLGKHYVKMGHVTSLSNRIMMDVARSHVVLISGKRGSGKSYSIGVIAEELTNLAPEIAQNIAVLIFDTMGIFWTMAHKNEKEHELLKQWGLKADKLNPQVFIPFGYFKKFKEKGVKITKEFALKVSEITADDWISTFGLKFTDPVAVVIERTINLFLEELEKNRIKDFDLDDVIRTIKKDTHSDKTERDAAVNFFEGAKTWGVFASKKQTGTKVEDLIQSAKTSVLDLSCYNSIGSFNIRALVIGLVTKKIFQQRMESRRHEEIQAVRHGLDYLNYKEKRETPLVWMFIDEAHEFLPKKGKTAATDALIQLLREGRQPGISVALATQQPGQIHHDVMTQSDIVISHRVTAKPDVDALNFIMQSYLAADIKTYLDNLPHLKGSAIILDDNSERIYPMRVRPRFTWHGGEAPTAIKVKKRL